MKDKKLRSIDTKFWDDTYIEILDPIEKLLFLYLLTSPATNLSGVYEISIKKIAYHTGLSIEVVNEKLKKFTVDKKFYYTNNHLISANFLLHQNFNPNMAKSAKNSFLALPENVVKYINELNLQTYKNLINEYKNTKKVNHSEWLTNGSLKPRKDEYEDEYEDEDEIGSIPSSIYISIENLSEKLNDEIFLSKVAAYAKTNQARAAELIPEFISSIQFDSEKNYRPLGKHQTHFQFWLKKYLKNIESNGANSKDKRQQRIEALNNLK